MGAASAKFQSSLDGDAVPHDEDASTDVGAIGRYFSSPDVELATGDPPLMTRTQKQARKGLPAVENLRSLARVWPKRAHQLWPELSAPGILSPLNHVTVDQLVRDFERRFVTGQPDTPAAASGRRMWKALAAGYLRYSDDNSNPRSLEDQLVKQMDRAKAEGRFLPWEYVFADASVTGRTHLRRGYRLAKEAMERFRAAALDTLYVDEFSRATRPAIESHRLARAVFTRL